MSSNRNRALIPLGVAALAAIGCAYVDISDTCVYSSASSLPKSDPRSLSLILSAPPGRIIEEPLVTISSPSIRNRVSVFEFDTRHRVDPGQAEIDDSKCKNSELMAFDLSGDRGEWTSFWNSLEDARFEIGVGFLESDKRLRPDSLGFALADVNTGQLSVSCGCYSD